MTVIDFAHGHVRLGSGLAVRQSVAPIAAAGA